MSLRDNPKYFEYLRHAKRHLAEFARVEAEPQEVLIVLDEIRAIEDLMASAVRRADEAERKRNEAKTLVDRLGDSTGQGLTRLPD